MKTIVAQLVELSDYFDQAGQRDLADQIDGLLKEAATVTVNTPMNGRPFSKDEEQRLIAIEYEHLYKLFLDAIPQIDYLKSSWPIIKDALDRCFLIIRSKMKEKTEAFNFDHFKERFAEIKETRQRLEHWRQREVEKGRVLAERGLILDPIRSLRGRLQRLYEDDQNLESIEQEFGHVINVLDNIFQKTTGEICNVSFPKG